MDQWIDLHIHTTASDGSCTPKEVVQLAKQNDVCAIAITDHDTMDGVEEAIEEGERLGVNVIRGIEISTEIHQNENAYMDGLVGRELHILGYFLNGAGEGLDIVIEGLKKVRESRNVLMLQRLNELGLAITMDDLREETSGEIMARPHFANCLVTKGYVKSIEEAFAKYLGDGKPGYVSRIRPSVEEGIRMIKDAGGIPVLAHPVLLGFSVETLDGLMGMLLPFGLMGVEAYYSLNRGNDTGNFLRLCIKHGLFATGGSDFHGAYRKEVQIGLGRGNLRVPYELLERMKGQKK
jgi:3',5'-nucleoside bisphosphate phosphatase